MGEEMGRFREHECDQLGKLGSRRPVLRSECGGGGQVAGRGQDARSGRGFAAGIGCKASKSSSFCFIQSGQPPGCERLGSSRPRHEGFGPGVCPQVNSFPAWEKTDPTTHDGSIG